MDMQAARVEQVALLERAVGLEAQIYDWETELACATGGLREVCAVNLSIKREELARVNACLGWLEEGFIQAEVQADLDAVRANEAELARQRAIEDSAPTIDDIEF